MAPEELLWSCKEKTYNCNGSTELRLSATKPDPLKGYTNWQVVSPIPAFIPDKLKMKRINKAYALLHREFKKVHQEMPLFFTKKTKELPPHLKDILEGCWPKKHYDDIIFEGASLYQLIERALLIGYQHSSTNSVDKYFKTKKQLAYLRSQLDTLTFKHKNHCISLRLKYAIQEANGIKYCTYNDVLLTNSGHVFNMKILCKIFPHIWGSKKFNHLDDAPRFEEFGVTQRQFYRECKLCKRMEFLRFDALGFPWWESRDHWLFPHNSSYPPTGFNFRS